MGTDRGTCSSTNVRHGPFQGHAPGPQSTGAWACCPVVTPWVEQAVACAFGTGVGPTRDAATENPKVCRFDDKS